MGWRVCNLKIQEKNKEEYLVDASYMKNHKLKKSNGNTYHKSS